MKTMRTTKARREASAQRSAASAPACRVCGSADVTLDEVAEHGRLLLGECGHCDHRWTERLLLTVALASEEVAEAA